MVSTAELMEMIKGLYSKHMTTYTKATLQNYKNKIPDAEIDIILEKFNECLDNLYLRYIDVYRKIYTDDELDGMYASWISVKDRSDKLDELMKEEISQWANTTLRESMLEVKKIHGDNEKSP